MKCPKCQHENADSAEFCEQCAAPLERRCVNCDSPVSLTARFCPQCGHSQWDIADNNRFASPKSYTPRHLAEKILTSRAAVAGERTVGGFGGMGEGGTIGAPAAIANALADALAPLGAEIFELPMTSERLFRLIEMVKARVQGE